MVRIIADTIDEIYIVENWLENGSQNTPMLNEAIYPNTKVEINYDILTSRPHALLKDNIWDQIAAVAYIDEFANIELIKPFKDVEGITVENGKVILPQSDPASTVEDNTDPIIEEVTEEESVEEVVDDSGTV